jgi:hypothetical protein
MTSDMLRAARELQAAYLKSLAQAIEAYQRSHWFLGSVSYWSAAMTKTRRTNHGN